MIFQLRLRAVDDALGDAAADEMQQAFSAAGAGYSMVSYLRPGLRPEGCTRPEFQPGAAVAGLMAFVNREFETEYPEEFAAQAASSGIASSAFNTLTVNRNYPTALHRDSGTRRGSTVALAVIKQGAVRCPTVFPALAPGYIEMESGDVLFFPGADLEHGNGPLDGPGVRWAFVFYCG